MIMHQIELAPAVRNVLASHVTEDSTPKATAQDFADAEFSAYGPEVVEAIGTRTEWLQRAAKDYPTLRLMAAFLQHDQIGALDTVRQAGPECVTELATCCLDLKEQYTALADILGCCGVRCLAALSRDAIETGAEA